MYSPGQSKGGGGTDSLPGLLVNSLLKPGFLLFSGSHNIECTHLQGVYRLGQAGLACTVGKDEVVASYFHFINRKAAGREGRTGVVNSRGLSRNRKSLVFSSHRWSGLNMPG